MLGWASPKSVETALNHHGDVMRMSDLCAIAQSQEDRSIRAVC
jgi:hypothetical protein